MTLPADFIEDQATEFRWGSADCVHFAASACRYFGGWEPRIPEYDSEIGAAKIISKAGSLRNLVEQQMGETVPPQDARVGDVVLASFSMGEVVGVADPPVFWVRADNGFVPVSLELALGVWPCRK